MRNQSISWQSKILHRAHYADCYNGQEESQDGQATFAGFLGSEMYYRFMSWLIH